MEEWEDSVRASRRSQPTTTGATKISITTTVPVKDPKKTVTPSGSCNPNPDLPDPALAPPTQKRLRTTGPTTAGTRGPHDNVHPTAPGHDKALTMTLTRT